MDHKLNSKQATLLYNLTFLHVRCFFLFYSTQIKNEIRGVH